MRHTVLYTILFVFLASGCDVLDRDEYQKDYHPAIAEGDDTRYILLEDYTGMRCTGCPEAADEIVKLKETFGERLITVSIHAGWFARPIGPYDLRCEAGNEYNDYFKITSNPKGVINRSTYNGEKVHEKEKWPGILDLQPAKSPVSIRLTPTFSESSNEFTVNIALQNRSEKADSYSLIMWLIEDNVITPQESLSGRITEYNQRHVLRGALNGTWGEDITLPVTKEEEINLQKGAYLLPAAYKKEDCSVVVLLCNKESREVIQVSESHLSVPLSEKQSLQRMWNN